MGYASNSYVTEAGTQMLATACLICGRPLRDPDSLERGVGPYCAEKHGIFTMTGSVDQAALAKALETAPTPMAEAVAAKMPEAARAMSAAIHAAGNAWEHKSRNAGHYIGSAMEIALALGFARTAQTLSSIFIDGTEYDEDGKVKRRGKQRGIVVTERSATEWEIKLPYLQGATWGQTKSAMKAAGVRTFKEQRDGSWHDVFRRGEREWLLVLNSLVDTLAGTLGVLPNGETFMVPEAPLPVPAPAGPAAGAPNREDPPPPPPAPDVKEGDTVEMTDGRVMIVARMGVNSKGPWIGLMTVKDAEVSMARKGYLDFRNNNAGFCGLRDVKQKVASAAEKRAVEEETGSAVPARSAAREIPEALRPWQREGVLWLDEKKSGVLAFEQGTGKTPTALAALDAPVLIVVPASLRENWRREANKWRPDLLVSKIDKAAEATDEAVAATCVIVGYDVLSSDAVFLKLHARGFRTLIVDEAQALKELKVKTGRGGSFYATKDSPARAQSVYRLSQSIPRKFFLTGTPMINGRPYELWPLLHMVAPDVWGDQEEYWNQYCDPQVVHLPGGKTRLNINGHANLPELRERINGHYMLRRTKAVLDLPEKVRQYNAVSLTREMADEYLAAASEFIDWVRRHGGAQAAMRASRAEIIAQLTALRRIAAIGKAPSVIEAAHRFLKDTGRPLIIMGHHSEALTSIETALEHLGHRVGTITGDQTPKQREKAVDGFQSGLPVDKPIERRKFLDVLVCSITAAGVGLTLTRAQDMFIMERVWRPFDLVQAEDRIHRYGQKNECIIQYFDAAGTIDDRLAALLAEKAKTAAEVIDGVDLDEDEAVERVVTDMFQSLVEGFHKNALHGRNGLLDSFGRGEPVYDWADPEVV